MAKNPDVLYAGGISASGENGTVDSCVVMVEEFVTEGPKQAVHPVSYFAEKNNVIVLNNIRGDFSSTDDVVYISYAERLAQETYLEIGWDFDFVWIMSDTGPVLWKAGW